MTLSRTLGRSSSAVGPGNLKRLDTVEDARMSESATFADFIRRIRAGDDRAAQELVDRYEPVIRREVRLRLKDPRLLSQLDWTDVCQSVMASFFLRAASGQFDLDEPGKLLKLLVVMTRNKLANQARWHRAGRRDYRRIEAHDPVDLERCAVPEPSPSRMVAGRELLEEFRRHLSDEERAMVDLRAQGFEWAEIAAELGGTPAARRKQFARAIDRVEQQLEGSASGDV
jgi:RNA polymerase sigma-70 factor (ECF subfamily)